MPISPSPIVQGYMGGQDQAQGALMTAEQMFQKTFSEQSFNILKSKFPQLMQYIVTFKTLDSDLEEGKAIGAFIVQKGNTVCYVPTIMTEGAITSCEVIYDRDADQFMPLSQDTVQKILNSNMLSQGNIMQGDVHVDDTQSLFRNMVRPPASSNVILASERDYVSSLPNSAKETIRNWFNENPKELAKIAECYDLEELGYKLQDIKELPSIKTDTVLNIKTASESDILFLSPTEKETLLNDGFLVKTSEDNDVSVAPISEIESVFDTEFNVEQYTKNIYGSDKVEDRVVKAAYAVGIIGNTLKMRPVIITNSGIFFDKEHYMGTKHDSTSIIVRNMTDEVTKSKLQAAGALTAHELKSFLTNKENYRSVCGHVVVLLPARNGRYVESCATDHNSHIGNNPSFNMEGDDLYIKVNESFEIHITKELSLGSVINTNSNDYHVTMHVPEDTMFFIYDSCEDRVPAGLLRNIDDLRYFITSKGRPLKVVDDGITTNITDLTQKKTANFQSKYAAAKWLNDNYNLTHNQVNTVLNHGVSVVLNKVAFMPPMQVDPNTGMEQAMYPTAQPAPMMQQPQPVAGMPNQGQFDPASIQAAAGIGASDAVDMGILNSFAQDPDMKALLVDYLPDFISMLDKLGRIIVLFCLEKKNLEYSYGSEKYNNVLGSCRKMFKLLGDTTESLKQYVHMN